MDTDLSQDSLAAFNSPPEMPEPNTPLMAQMSLPLPDQATDPAIVASKQQSQSQSQSQSQTSNLASPPPSTQVLTSSQKLRTPTPPVSHISTPPPTNEGTSHSRVAKPRAGNMSAEQIDSASAEQLRTVVSELRAAYSEANMSAAHYKLQYNMLSQESAAAIERMAVEARMAQSETDIIHYAEQARAAAASAQAPIPEPGTIPVAKEYYHSLVQQIQQLTETNSVLCNDVSHHEKLLGAQDSEIARLEDTVVMLRDRIRENREQVNRYRRSNTIDATPRSVYSTPRKPHASQHQVHQGQPFEALLQASEMASRETARSAGTSNKRGHTRNTHSLSSLPSTPQRGSTKMQKPSVIYQTPSHRQTKPAIPYTAPLPRTSALRTPDIYAQHLLPVAGTPTPNPRKHPRPPPAPASDDGTVSDPDRANDDDSEADTEILEPDVVDVGTSQASAAAARLLASDGQARHSFVRDTPVPATAPAKGSMRQGTLFGSVRKAGVGRGAADEQGSPSKKARKGESLVGLGIAGVGEE